MVGEQDDSGEIESGPVITGEMSEEAIFNAAVSNDENFMDRLIDLYEHFVEIGKRATSNAAFSDAQSAFANAMNIANTMHNIALVREKFTRDRLDLHPNRGDLELDSDEDPFEFAPDAVDGL